MKKLFLGMAVVLVFGLMASVVMAGVGNTIPVNGKHYNLNILGVELKEDKDKAVGDSKGHTLFVPLWTKKPCKIIMTQDPNGEFKVVDRDGTDGEAEFNIAPGHYNVYAAALGKRGNVHIDAKAYFEDADQGTKLIPLGYVDIARVKGKQPTSVNINNLFYVDVTVCLKDPVTGIITCTEYTDTWVFDIVGLLEYFWEYTNSGLKLLQVRFYPCTIDCTGAASDYCRWDVSDEFPDGVPICPSKKTVEPPAAPGLTETLTTTWGDIKE
jgi:hypothetical protein